MTWLKQQKEGPHWKQTIVSISKLSKEKSEKHAFSFAVLDIGLKIRNWDSAAFTWCINSKRITKVKIVLIYRVRHFNPTFFAKAKGSYSFLCLFDCAIITFGKIWECALQRSDDRDLL